MRSLALVVAGAATLASLAGCGDQYRPVVTAINPVGPATQPTKYAIAISSTGASSPGLATMVDFSGDTVLITANVGNNPYYLALDSSGVNAYTLNGDKTLTSFPITTSLLSSQVLQSTLLDNNGVLPPYINPLGLNTFISEPGRNSVAQYTGTPLGLKQELPVASLKAPLSGYVVGVANAPRVYVISAASGSSNGTVSTIETASNTIDANPIAVGVDPVYGVMTADTRRAFIMNQGSNNISVINSQANVLDTTPTLADLKAVAPVWADFAPTLNELVVANEGKGTDQGSISIYSIPLCSVVAQPGNQCDPNNPVDAIGFGTLLANVPVGINPVMVAVLQDGTRAYVLNKGDMTRPCSAPSTSDALGNCTISVVNLTSNTVTATIPLPLSTNPLSTNANGHPTWIAATTGTPTGKVYVVSPESNFMTVIRTDTDSVLTTIPLQGTGVSVRVTAP